MKNQVSNSKSLILSLLLIIGLSFSLSAQDAEVKKEISESYKVTKDFTLGIDNKYGAIDLVNWDKNELEVVVEMKVKAGTEEKAQKILDKIEIEIDESGSGVDFLTKFEITNFGNKTTVEVNYKVSAPASINVKLMQKYGSIYLEEITGNAEIALKYGTMKAQSLVNASGKANLLAMGYSEAKIKNGGKLTGKFAYSELTCGALEAYEGKISYSDIKIESLGKKFVTEASYSDVEVNNIEKGIELVDISCGYGDVELTAADGASFSYEMDTKYGDIKAPAGAEKAGTKDHDHGPNHHKAVKGKVGSGAGGKVIVHAKYSDLKLK